MPSLPLLRCQLGRHIIRHNSTAAAATQTPLTLLHKTNELVLRLLSAQQNDAVLAHWSEKLSKAQEHLARSAKEPINVSIISHGSWSGSRELVTAALDEAFSSDVQRRKALYDRDTNKIEYLPSGPPTAEVNVLFIPASYLQNFAAPISILEGPLPDAEADIRVVVCDPLSSDFATLIKTYEADALPTIFVFSCVPSAEEQRNAISASSSLPILFIDPYRALNSLQILHNSPESVQKYQDDFVSSRIASLQAALDQTIGSSSAGVIRTRTVLSHSLNALHACRAALVEEESRLAVITQNVKQLQTEVSKVSSETVLGGQVTEALRTAEKEVRPLMNRLTWWKALWRADEVGSIVSAAVQQAWCRDLHEQLVYKTGRLAALQATLDCSTLSIVSSSLLKNELEQIRSSPSHALTTASLTTPIHTRRAQIIEYPTSKLALAAQRVVFTVGGSVASGIGLSGTSFLASPEHFALLASLEPGTAIGIGAFTALAGTRWAVSIWEKAKRKWWKDWARVSEGLERDLAVTLDRAIDERVTQIAGAGANKLSSWSKQRQVEIDTLKAAVDILQRDVEIAYDRCSPGKTH